MVPDKNRPAGRDRTKHHSSGVRCMKRCRSAGMGGGRPNMYRLVVACSPCQHAHLAAPLLIFITGLASNCTTSAEWKRAVPVRHPFHLFPHGTVLWRSTEINRVVDSGQSHDYRLQQRAGTRRALLLVRSAAPHMLTCVVSKKLAFSTSASHAYCVLPPLRAECNSSTRYYFSIFILTNYK